MPRVPGRTKRAAPAQGPRGDEVRKEGAGAGRASAPTCPLALAGEAPAASSAVTSPRGALELWLPMMRGSAGGAPGAAPGSRRRGSLGGVGLAGEGVGLAPEGEGCRGKPSCAPAPPDPKAAPAAAQLRARMPPASRRAAYISGPRARGVAGHLNERPIEGRGRAQVARPASAVGYAGGLVPQPARPVGCDVEGARRALGELGRGARCWREGERANIPSPHGPPLGAGSSPTASVLPWQSLPRTLERLTHHMLVVSYAPENAVIEAAGPLARICTPSGPETGARSRPLPCGPARASLGV